MSKDELGEAIRYGKMIGLKTIKDYALFQAEQQQPNETLVEALKRYISELGPSFKGVKDDRI